MLKDETVGFFKNIMPFSMMAVSELDNLVECMTIVFFPRGEKILEQNGPPAEFLYIIKKGGAKVYIESDLGDETVIDYRSEGEQFGLLSLVSGDRSRATVVTIEDTLAYLVPRARVLAIFQSNPSVHEYFLKSFVINFIDKTYAETTNKGTGFAGSEKLLFSTTVADLIRRKPVIASPETSIRDAALKMVDEGTSSIVIVNDDGQPVGMVTDRDLREKVVAVNKSTEAPVGEIMSSTLYVVDSEEFCFEALLKMMRNDVHHLPVIDDGRLIGMVTNHDFMVMQGTSPAVLVKDIEKARGVEDIRKTIPGLCKAVALLLREGAKARNVTGFITELAEKTINRLIELDEKDVDPPLPYTLFIYGAGARRELALDMDIRLGIIYENTHDKVLAKRAREYFQKLRVKLAGGLHECCQPASKADILRPELVSSRAEWKVMLEDWAEAGRRELPLSGLFDMRAIRGDRGRVGELSAFLHDSVANFPEFLKYLAALVLSNRPPIGFFKQFVVEKSGEHMNELDLHQRGIKPLVDAVRLFAISTRSSSVSTMRRLKDLGKGDRFDRAGDFMQVHDYFMSLLIQNQLRQINDGMVADTFLNPDTLTVLEKKTLKEGFLLTAAKFDTIEGVHLNDND